MLNTILLAIRLLSNDPETQSAIECSAVWTTDGDGWQACADGLRTWTCEMNGLCLVDGERPTMRVMLVPDPVWAGEQEWI